MYVWWNIQFSSKDLESSNWNNVSGTKDMYWENPGDQTLSFDDWSTHPPQR